MRDIAKELIAGLQVMTDRKDPAQDDEPLDADEEQEEREQKRPIKPVKKKKPRK